MSTFLVYGANGYTGQLIAREAVVRGMRPILAGRNAEAVTALAGQLGLEQRIFTLEDAAATRAWETTTRDLVVSHRIAAVTAICLLVPAHLIRRKLLV